MCSDAARLAAMSARVGAVSAEGQRRWRLSTTAVDKAGLAARKPAQELDSAGLPYRVAVHATSAGA